MDQVGLRPDIDLDNEVTAADLPALVRVRNRAGKARKHEKRETEANATKPVV
jgi:hypothetical protein